MDVFSLQTPALVVDADAFDHNLATMTAALPHVKAHKSTALAARQAAVGHRTFTCATIREVEGMAAAGMGDDLLLANEVVDARRLGAVAASGARVTVAVDSAETLMFDVGQGRVADTLAPIRELLDLNLDRLEQLYERGETITGTPSGYTDLDEMLSGLQPSATFAHQETERAFFPFLH